MRSSTVALLVIVLSAVAVGCAEPQPTPAELEAEFTEVITSLDEERPGAAVARLSELAEKAGPYELAADVERQIMRFRAAATGRAREARELARAGEFDRAQVMLEDLADHLPDTEDGKSAREHLAFDFHFGKAQWLMVRQRWRECEAVARPLLDRDLTRVQEEQVQQLLDNVGLVGAAMSQAERAQARAACRQLVIHLEMRMAEEGTYPATLSLAEAESWDPLGSRSLRRSLSAIESYEPRADGYSFVAVTADGGRIRVVDGAIEE